MSMDVDKNSISVKKKTEKVVIGMFKKWLLGIPASRNNILNYYIKQAATIFSTIDHCFLWQKYKKFLTFPNNRLWPLRHAWISDSSIGTCTCTSLWLKLYAPIRFCSPDCAINMVPSSNDKLFIIEKQKADFPWRFSHRILYFLFKLFPLWCPGQIPDHACISIYLSHINYPHHKIIAQWCGWQSYFFGREVFQDSVSKRILVVPWIGNYSSVYICGSLLQLASTV